MRSLDYVDVLTLSAKQAGLDPEQVAADEFATFRLLHSDRLKRIWDHRPWYDLCETEKRYFRPLYTNTTYTATTEVYYPGPKKYYQALRAVIVGQAPATFDGTTWTANLAYWAESKASYDAAEYSATTAYGQGAIVYYSLTDRFYQLFAVTSTGNLPTDAANWGVLTPFNRYIAYAQAGLTAFEHVYSAWTADPENDASAQRLKCWLTGDGAQIREDVAYAWLVFKLRRPRLTGDVLDEATGYAVGAQVYFSSSVTRGNFYDCAVTAAAGETPDTAAAKWAKVEIPAQWETWLTHGAAADYLLPDGEVMVRDREFSIAQDDLERQAVLHDSMVADRLQSNVMTR